jgi:hypothetical protein
MKNLGNKIKTVLPIIIGGAIFCTSVASGISSEFNKIKYGKERYKQYTETKQSIDSAFLSDVKSLREAYWIQVNGIGIKTEYGQEIKKEYQKQEAALTAKHYKDLKNLENSLKK